MLDSARISVLLASDFPILSESLLSIFKDTQDIHLTGCAGSEEELVQQMEKTSTRRRSGGYFDHVRQIFCVAFQNSQIPVENPRHQPGSQSRTNHRCFALWSRRRDWKKNYCCDTL